MKCCSNAWILKNKIMEIWNKTICWLEHWLHELIAQPIPYHSQEMDSTFSGTVWKNWGNIYHQPAEWTVRSSSRLKRTSLCLLFSCCQFDRCRHCTYTLQLTGFQCCFSLFSLEHWRNESLIKYQLLIIVAFSKYIFFFYYLSAGQL